MFDWCEKKAIPPDPKEPFVTICPIEKDALPLIRSWRNNPKNRQYFREYRVLTTDQQAAWYESLPSDPNTLMFAIESQTDFWECVGVCGLCNIDWLARSAEVSLYIGEGYIDKVIAPQAFDILMNYATWELGLRRLWAEIWDFDLRKKELLEAAGYKLEVQRRETHWNKRWHNSLIYGRVFE